MDNCVLEKWITHGSKTPFYARKLFEINKKIKSAKVTVCGLGQFNLFINGKKVGDNILDPAWTDYRKIINYLEFDVTDMLKSGANVIASEVGNGWYIMDRTTDTYSFSFPAFMPANPNDYKPFNDVLILSLNLQILYADNTRDCIETDESWLTAGHMALMSNVYGSEFIDGRKRIDNWNDVSCDCKDWSEAQLVSDDKKPSGKLVLQSIPSIKKIATYEGSFINHVNNHLIYDFSQNASGILSFDVKGKRGDVINLYPAEKLGTDGDVDQMAKNWMMINVLDKYIIGQDDCWEHVELTFTYVCGRYLAVEGCDASQVKNMQLHAISSAYEKAGTFECDDKRYMQIYDMIEKAVESNMMSVHTDCPTIERFAWQEENHLTAPFIMYMKKVDAHWRKFLQDIRVAQHTADDYFYDFEGNKFYPGDGLIPSQAPCYIPNVLPVPGMGSFYDIIAWGSSIILATNWHYEFYGDKSIIQENYEAGAKYFDFLKTRVNEDGFINHGLGDWGNPAGVCARENIETAFLYADAITLEKFANILGLENDAKAYASYANEIKDNYNSKLLVYDEEKKRYCYKVWEQKESLVITPAAQALPLFWGLCLKEKERDVVEALRDSVEVAGSFQAGEVGQPYIIQTLSKYDMNDLICKVILSEKHPSYYAFILDGETSLGEYWETNPRSHCHDMMGHIIEWYYNGLAGIKPLEPGFKKVLIKPYLPDSMNTMKCTYQSASGLITVSMRRVDGKIELKVDADPRIEVVYM